VARILAAPDVQRPNGIPISAPTTSRPAGMHQLRGTAGKTLYKLRTDARVAR